MTYEPNGDGSYTAIPPCAKCQCTAFMLDPVPSCMRCGAAADRVTEAGQRARDAVDELVAAAADAPSGSQLVAGYDLAYIEERAAIGRLEIEVRQ